MTQLALAFSLQAFEYSEFTSIFRPTHSLCPNPCYAFFLYLLYSFWAVVVTPAQPAINPLEKARIHLLPLRVKAHP
ncbi:hypothetical protein WDZ92_01175 [Nostoc sp. NIES-2111]